jgi:hypothetical protein
MPAETPEEVTILPLVDHPSVVPHGDLRILGRMKGVTDERGQILCQRAVFGCESLTVSSQGVCHNPLSEGAYPCQRPTRPILPLRRHPCSSSPSSWAGLPGSSPSPWGRARSPDSAPFRHAISTCSCLRSTTPDAGSDWGNERGQGAAKGSGGRQRGQILCQRAVFGCESLTPLSPPSHVVGRQVDQFCARLRSGRSMDSSR